MPKQTLPPAPRYIWQHAAWPRLTFDALALAPALDQARLEQGKLLGLLDAIGLDQAQEVQRDLTDLLTKRLLRVEGVGKATRYAVNLPGWHQPALKP